MEYPKSDINKVKRSPKKASYNKTEVYRILDAADICNIAFLWNGRAMVQPINYGREKDKIYIHGSHKNRMTNAIVDSVDLSLSVSFLDAMKLTRSAYHHSVNFRSVVVFGKAKELTSETEKLNALKHIINHFVPDRWDNCREPNQKELNATRVIEIEIETASAKIADSPSQEEKQDLELDYWAGIIPVKQVLETPIPDPKLTRGTALPKHVKAYYENNKNGK